MTYERTRPDPGAATTEERNDGRRATDGPSLPAGGVELSKATIALHAQNFVLNRFGEAGWQSVLERLPADDRRTFENILPIAWYPHAADARLFRAIDEGLGRGDKKLLVDLGRFEAEQDLRGIHRLFLRLANPAYVLEKASDYWSRFHNTGRWRVERKPNGASGTLYGWGAPDEVKCVYLGAYIARMFELVGVRQLELLHPRCRCRGDRGCTFEGSWGAHKV